MHYKHQKHQHLRWSVIYMIFVHKYKFPCRVSFYQSTTWSQVVSALPAEEMSKHDSSGNFLSQKEWDKVRAQELYGESPGIRMYVYNTHRQLIRLAFVRLPWDSVITLYHVSGTNCMLSTGAWRSVKRPISWCRTMVLQLAGIILLCHMTKLGSCCFIPRGWWVRKNASKYTTHFTYV